MAFSDASQLFRREFPPEDGPPCFRCTERSTTVLGGIVDVLCGTSQYSCKPGPIVVETVAREGVVKAIVLPNASGSLTYTQVTVVARTCGRAAAHVMDPDAVRDLAVETTYGVDGTIRKRQTRSGIQLPLQTKPNQYF